MSLPDLVALPRAHLHLHLEGAARPSTLFDLAERDGTAAMDLDGYDDLPGFVQAYETARALIATLDDLRRVASEVAEDALGQGFVWLEVHLSPQSYEGRLGRIESVLEAVLDGLRAPQRDDTGVGVVLGINRGQGASHADDVVSLAERSADVDGGVVGLGLVGDERHSAAPFIDHFARARAVGLLSVPHAGETQGPASVWEALGLLGADRIGHGIAAARDDRLLEWLSETGTCLDVCPTSNVRLGVSLDWERHPVHDLLGAGVRVSLNSDDPTFFGASGLDEYRTAAELGLRVDEIAATSLAASAAPKHVIEPAYAMLGTWRERNPLSAPGLG